MLNVYHPSKLAFHRGKLEDIAQGRITSPLYVRVKPTNVCNHRCFYCSYDPSLGYILSEGFHRNDFIPGEKMLEVLDDFRDMRVRAVTFSGGGEPLCYPYIENAMKRTLDNGIDLSIITNGQLLEGRRSELLRQAKWVRISANASDAETFEKIRRKPQRMFYQLSDNMAEFARTKNPECELGALVVINAVNYNRVYDITKFFKELGLDNVRFLPAWIPDDFFGYHSSLRPVVVEQIKKAQAELQDDRFRIYDDYEEHFKFAGVEERTYGRCFMIEVQPVIAADCGVYACQDKTYTQSGFLGSIKDTSFRRLWESEELQKRIREFDPKTSCCHHCSKDNRNISIGQIITDLDHLDRYLPESDKHKNFI